MAALTEEKFKRLKQEVEFARNEATRAAGGLEQLEKQLKDEFDCTDLKIARSKHEALVKAAAKAEKAFEVAVEAYEKKWKKKEDKEDEEAD